MASPVVCAEFLFERIYMSNIKANDSKWIGQKFGKLTVIEPVYVEKRHRWLWRCKCDCGNETIAWPNLLIRGKQTACHCGKSKTFHDMYYIHGESHTRLSEIWSGMKKRCDNKNSASYSNYGGRGITYCEAWKEYLNFREWALNNGYTDEMSLERKDVNGNYCPENCTWISIRDQAKNKTTSIKIEINGISKCLSEWCEIYGKNYSKVHSRIRRNQMTPIRALLKDEMDYGYRKCELCGKEFKMKNGREKYCREECRAEAARIRSKKWHKTHYESRRSSKPELQ